MGSSTLCERCNGEAGRYNARFIWIPCAPCNGTGDKPRGAKRKPALLGRHGSKIRPAVEPVLV